MYYPELEALAVDYYRRFMRVADTIHGKGEVLRRLLDKYEGAEIYGQLKSFGTVLARSKKGARVIKNDLEELIIDAGYAFQAREVTPLPCRLLVVDSMLCSDCLKQEPELIEGFGELHARQAYDKLESWFIRDQHRSVMGINWFVHELVKYRWHTIEPHGRRLYSALTDVFANLKISCTCMLNVHRKANPQLSRLQVRDRISRQPREDAFDITYYRKLCATCTKKEIIV